MKSRIFRLFAWGFACLAGVAFAFVPGNVTDKENRRDVRQRDLDELKAKMIADENASKAAISRIMRETTGFRDEKDEAAGKLKEIEEKISFLKKQKEEVAEEMKKAEEERLVVAEAKASTQTELSKVMEDINPLKVTSDQLAAQRKALQDEMAVVREENQSLQTKLDKLTLQRDQILVDFREREKFYRETIQTPPWIYYGDKLNLEVTNSRSSGSGVFLPIGFENGLKSGMEFLVRRVDPTAPSSRSRRIRATLVQSNYCFAEEISGFGESGIFLKADEKIELERSGETKEEESSSSESDAPPTDSAQPQSAELVR